MHPPSHTFLLCTSDESLNYSELSGWFSSAIWPTIESTSTTERNAYATEFSTDGQDDCIDVFDLSREEEMSQTEILNQIIYVGLN